MKELIIHHRADADGMASMAVCKQAFANAIPFGWDYGDPPIDLGQILGPGEKAQIILIDLSPEPLGIEVDRYLEGQSNQIDLLYWIDHHKTALENPKWRALPGVRKDGIAACRLAWSVMERVIKLNRTGEPLMPIRYLIQIPDQARIVDHQVEIGDCRKAGEPLGLFLTGLRDVWKHVGTGETEFRANLWNLYLQAIAGSSSNFGLRDQIDHSLIGLYLEPDDQQVQRCLDQARPISMYADRTNAEVASRGAFILVAWGMRILALNTQLRGSAILEPTAIDMNCRGITVDAMMVFGLSKDGHFNVSLYHAPHQKHQDLSTIAKAFGGGGHAGACGFRLSQKQMFRLLTGDLPLGG